MIPKLTGQVPRTNGWLQSYATGKALSGQCKPKKRQALTPNGGIVCVNGVGNHPRKLAPPTKMAQAKSLRHLNLYLYFQNSKLDRAKWTFWEIHISVGMWNLQENNSKKALDKNPRGRGSGACPRRLRGGWRCRSTRVSLNLAPVFCRRPQLFGALAHVARIDGGNRPLMNLLGRACRWNLP